MLERALAKEANARYQTAEKMASDLSELETPLQEQALEDALFQLEQGALLRARDQLTQKQRPARRVAQPFQGHVRRACMRGPFGAASDVRCRDDRVRFRVWWSRTR